MNNLSRYFLLCIFSLSTLSIYAQNSAEQAKTILDKVSTFYKAQKSIDTEFSLNIINEDADINETQKGSLQVKGEKYKITSDELIRVSDGYSIWTHFIEDEEVQITEFDPEENELTPAKIFTIYEEGFRQEYVGQTDLGGNTFEKVILHPTDPDNPYEKIGLFINPQTHLITKANVYSKNGSLIVYKIFNTSFSKDLEDEMFNYNVSKLDDIEVIDLR